MAQEQIVNDSRQLLRLRADLQWQRREGRNSNYWVVRDPISLRFFTMSEDERRVLLLLQQSSRSAGDVIGRAVEITSLKPDAVRLLLQTLIRGGLIRVQQLGSVPSHSPSHSHVNRKPFVGLMVGIAAWPLKSLSFRVPLGDPTRFLEKTKLLGRLTFSTTAILGLALAWIMFASICVLRWDRLESNVLDAKASFGWLGFLLFLLAYLVLKTAHELGHAVACHRFGAQCREAGLYMICFVPCFYCDVTDAWKIHSRWRRAWISAAGMYCELWIAVIAGFVWLVCQPGILQSLSLSIFLIGSFGTLLINGNPLLRFDGYYLLSDLTDVPNLAGQSSRATESILRRMISSNKTDLPQLDAPVTCLVTYNILSWTYRIGAVGLILWSIDYFFGQQRIGQLGRLVVFSLLFAFAVQWCFMTFRQIYQWWRHPVVSRVKLVLFLLCVVVASWYVLHTPFATNQHLTGVFSAERIPIYVTRGGSLVQCVASGSHLEAGDDVYRLESKLEMLAIAKLETSLGELQVKLKYWDANGTGEVENAAVRETLARSLESMQQRLETMKAEMSELDAKSPVAGRFVAATIAVPETQAIRRISLENRSIDKLVRLSDGQHLGRKLERGTLVGWILDDTARHVDAFVDERQVESIHRGMTARLRLSADPSRDVRGIVEAVRQEPLEQLPPYVRDAFDATTKKIFRLRVILEAERPNSWGAEVNELRVHLSVRTAPQSLWERIKRFVAASTRL